MWRKIKNSIWLNILLFAAASFLGYNAFFMVKDAVLVRLEERARTKEIERLLKKKEDLEAYLWELQEREAVVREAKERLNLKLPGEKVVVVMPNANSTSTEMQQRASLWERVGDFLRKLFSNYSQ